MAETKDQKSLSLSDLGLDEESNPTPADIAEKEHKPDIHEVKTKPTAVGQPEVKSITATETVEGPIKDEPKKDKPAILTPNGIKNADGNRRGPNKYKEIGDVNKFLGRKPKPKTSPVEDTRNELYKLADDGIERTKKELIAPGGRIDEAKQKFIEYTYPQLMSRAEKNPNLMNRIKKIREIMDSDPRFDDATETEKKGYILFTVGKSKKTGIDHAYFGIEESSMDSQRPQLSSETAKEIDRIVQIKDDDDFNFDDEFDTVILGTNTDGPSLLQSIPEIDNEHSETASIPDVSKAIVNNDEDKLDSDISVISESEEETIEEEEEDPMSEEELKAIQKDYKDQLIKALRLDRVDDLDGFVVATKPLNLKSALKPKQQAKMTYVWPLLNTGIGVEMTPFESNDIIGLNPSNTNFETVQGLTEIFSILYKHIVNPGKAPFETWLRQVSDYDIDGLVFGGYAATFKDTNHITYECSKCSKVFLQEKNIMDMVTFPNDDVKKRFNDILSKDTVLKHTYLTSPKRISEDYAIGFTSQSIYSNLFETASLSEDFAKKYKPIIDIMPNIDKVYKIDNENKQLIPIKFGVVENSLSKTVQNKVRALNAIFKTFTPDERAIVAGEAQKIAIHMNQWRLTYCIPETTCPHCGHIIERRETNPLNILFTRAQLPLVAAYIPE